MGILSMEKVYVFLTLIFVFCFLFYLLQDHSKAKNQSSENNELDWVTLIVKRSRIIFFIFCVGVLLYMLFKN